MIVNHIGFGSSSWIISLVILFVIKVCSTMIFQAISDIRLSDYIQDLGNGECYFSRDSEGEPNVYQIPLYLLEFFLPVLGGLLTDRGLSEKLVLCISGVIYLVSGVYIAAVEKAKLICLPSLYLIGVILGGFANGIAMAPLLAAPLKISHGQFGTQLPGLITYYIAASLGGLIGQVPRLFGPNTAFTGYICITGSFPIIALSVMLRPDWSSYRRRFGHQMSDGFVFPTQARLIRYFLLLAPLVMLVNIFASVFGALYCLEKSIYRNATNFSSSQSSCTESTTAYHSATISTLILLAACYRMGYISKSKSHINTRFYSGAFLLLLSKAAMIAWNNWAASRGEDLPDGMIVHAVYASSSCLDGVANGLSMVAGYEIMYRVAPAGSKNLVMGFLITIWAVGAAIAGGTMLALLHYPVDDPVLKPSLGKSNKLYISYVIIVCEISMMILFYGIVNVKLSKRMVELEVEESYDSIGQDTDSNHELMVDLPDDGNTNSERQSLIKASII